MIWVAIVILVLIGNTLDAIILYTIQFTNAAVSLYEMTKAGDAVAALQHSLQPTATVKRNSTWETISATLLVPGDTILLSSGVNVPADCRINNPSPAYIDVDQSSLTGESLPITFYKGDSCKMGSTVVRGEVEVSRCNSFYHVGVVFLYFFDRKSDLQSDDLHFIFNVFFIISTTEKIGYGRIYWLEYFFWKNCEISAERR